MEPQPYLEFNYLVRHAKAVITDSGGVTEETTVMGVPCITLRDTTERPETVTIGTNEVIGTDPERLREALDRLFAGQWKTGGIPEKWDGKAGERIAAQLETLSDGTCVTPAATALRYWHTLRHLRVQQIVGRAQFRLARPMPDLRPAPGRRHAEPGRWVAPARRRPSLVGPHDLPLPE